jgi:hypothetical protein
MAVHMPKRGSHVLPRWRPKKPLEELGNSIHCYSKAFQSALDPDKLVTLELWDDQAALDAHAQRNVTRPPNPALVALRADGTRPREDYTYNRTR